MQSIRTAFVGSFTTLLLIGAILLLALVVDQIEPLKQFDLYLKQHPQPWVGLTLGGAAAGLLLLVSAWVGWALRAGRRMSESEARAFMETNTVSEARHVFRGRAAGIATPEGSASFGDIKQAFRTGAWLHDPKMRVFCLGLLGLLLLLAGGLGYVIVTAPPTVKVICAAALFYALGRTVWAFGKSSTS